VPRAADAPRAPARCRTVVSALVAVAACAEQAPGPIPNIEDVYLGTWSLAVEGADAACPAALTISDQTDSAFGTTTEIRRRNGTGGLACNGLVASGSGVVRADRTVRALAELVEPHLCTLKEPNTGLAGTVANGRITLSARYTYRCPEDHVWTLRFAGSTTGNPLPPYPDVLGTYSGSWTTTVPGLQVICPVAVALDSQTHGDVAAAYTLEAQGSCLLQPTQPLTGFLTVDGDLLLTGAPPVPAGCTVNQGLVLSGVVGSGSLTLTGGFALQCGSVLREYGVVLAASRP
jgi:hypothetical protein